MARHIGIRHRTKKTAKGEARPTQVFVKSGQVTKRLELETETNELDFVLGIYPVSFREPNDGEDISRIARRFLKTRKLKKGEDPKDFPQHLLVTFPGEKRPQLVTKVPLSYDGFRSGDIVAMSLGGSGDRLAFALSRRGLQIGASIIRIPPNALKKERGEGDKNDDAKLLAQLVERQPSLFYETGIRDRQLIKVRESYRALMDAMKDRIACEQRLRKRLIGAIFLSDEGKYPEGSIEDEFDERKASDAILLNLVNEEQNRQFELENMLSNLDIFTTIFEPVEGCGPRIAARLISSIVTARRFEVQPDQMAMSELRKKIGECLVLGKYYEDKPNAEPLFPANHNGFMRIQAVAKWKRENGKAEESAILEEAVDHMQERRGLTRQARQKSEAKFRKYCGVAPSSDGKFLRHRVGEVGSWSPDCRQALFLLGDQCNRRPDSVWGKKLRENKELLRRKHPEIECSVCGVPWEQCALKKPEYLAAVGEKVAAVMKSGKHVRRYTNGHIHKMAIWKTAAQFVDWLFGEWRKIEGGTPVQSSVKDAA